MHVFCHELNFCINPALFWCIALVPSSILTKISNFIEKRTKFGTFLKIELCGSYIHQKKAKIIQKLVSWKKVWFFRKNIYKNVIYWFLSKKSIRLGNYQDAVFFTAFFALFWARMLLFCLQAGRIRQYRMLIYPMKTLSQP